MLHRRHDNDRTNGSKFWPWSCSSMRMPPPDSPSNGALTMICCHVMCVNWPSWSGSDGACESLHWPVMFTRDYSDALPTLPDEDVFDPAYHQLPPELHDNTKLVDSRDLLVDYYAHLAGVDRLGIDAE
ncbi:unnamed protein product [Sphagnum balticum]